MTTAPAPAPPPPLRLALVELCEEYEAMHAKNDDVRFGADAVLRAVRDVLNSHPEQPPPSRDRYEQHRERLIETLERPADMVREFHEAFGVPVRTTPVANPPESDLRTRLLAEEVGEYYAAVEAADVVAVADALADIAYVVYGSALSHGIDLDVALAEVHRSNMSKLGPDGAPIRRDDGKVMKGPDYSPPDIAAVLRGLAGGSVS